ncbi:hypothetical protein ACFMJF_11095, partial [Acinetobacter baumannii]
MVNWAAPCSNLLPYDGEVQDYGCILTAEE